MWCVSLISERDPGPIRAAYPSRTVQRRRAAAPPPRFLKSASRRAAVGESCGVCVHVTMRSGTAEASRRPSLTCICTEIRIPVRSDSFPVFSDLFHLYVKKNFFFFRNHKSYLNNFLLASRFTSSPVHQFSVMSALELNAVYVLGLI